MKRAREDGDHSEQPAKVRRIPALDRLSRLPTELLVRILGYVPVSSLLVCQRISKKFKRLAVDSELWKAAYYKNFVLPRASRIPGIKDTNATSEQLRWEEDELETAISIATQLVARPEQEHKCSATPDFDGDRYI
ncbi:hypothetical protein SLS60_005966 [Paraconiothyrium brasiliense]|uniref:F-box domain-containing protein n=1 Tax=Paraconiothyrium brasiliense TaxID=300254 RepID=A0ABR3RDN8_9PLEO